MTPNDTDFSDVVVPELSDFSVPEMSYSMFSNDWANPDNSDCVIPDISDCIVPEISDNILPKISDNIEISDIADGVIYDITNNPNTSQSVDFNSNDSENKYSGEHDLMMPLEENGGKYYERECKLSNLENIIKAISSPKKTNRYSYSESNSINSDGKFESVICDALIAYLKDLNRKKLFLIFHETFNKLFDDTLLHDEQFLRWLAKKT